MMLTITSAINITPIIPTNNSYLFNTTNNITINITGSANLTNATLYIYNSTGGLYNTTFWTFVNGITSTIVNSVIDFIDGIYTMFIQVFDINNNKKNLSGTNFTVCTGISTNLPITDKLLMYYTFDNANLSSGIVDNVKGLSQYDGIINGTVTTGRPGLLGESFYFNGTHATNNQWVKTGINESVFNTTLSMNFWYKPNSNTSGAARCLFYNDMSGAGTYIDITTSGQMSYRMGHENNLINVVNITNTTWQMVTLVWERNQTLRAYYNGVQVGNMSAADQPVTGISPRWYIGALASDIGSNDGWYSSYGLIDEVGWWNDTLSDAEVLALYNNGTGLTYPFTTNVGCNILDVSATPANNTWSATSNIEFSLLWYSYVSAVNATLYIANSTAGINTTDNVTLSGNSGIWDTYKTLLDGTYNWYFKLYNEDDNSNTSGNYTLHVDTTIPEISFTDFTTTAGNKSSSTIKVNLSTRDDNFYYSIINLYNSTGLRNSSGAIQTNFTLLEDGRYFLNASVSDYAGNKNNTETRNITIDTTAPIISTLSPTITYANRITEFNVTVLEPTSGINNCRLYFNNTLNGTMDYNSLTNIANRSVMFYQNNTIESYVTCQDVVGWNGSSVKSNVSIIINLSIIPFMPINNTFSNTSEVNISANYSGLNLSNATLYIYNQTGGLYNNTFYNLTDQTNGTLSTIVSFFDGIFTWFWNIINIFDNTVQSDNYTLLVDTITPTISFTSITTSAGFITINTIMANISRQDTNLNYSIINLYNSTGLHNSSNNITFNFTNLPDGIYNLNASVYDNVSHINNTETRQITIDGSYPSISFTPITTSGYKTTNSIIANITAYDFTLNYTIINLYNSTGLHNSSDSFNITFTNLPDGIYNLNATIVDNTTRRNNTETRQIIIDTNLVYAVNITQVTPPNNTYSSNLSWNISMNYSSGSNLSNATLHIFNATGEINQTFFNLSGTKNGIISTIFDFISGVYSWFFEIFNIIGNVNYTENRTLTLDVELPNISSNINQKAFLYGTNISGSINFSTNGSYIDNYKIMIDNNAIYTIVDAIGIHTAYVQYNISWNTTNLAEQNNHTLFVIARSANNLTSSNKSYNFSVQSIPNIIALWPHNATQSKVPVYDFNATFNTSWFNTTCNLTLDSLDLPAGGVEGITNINSKNATYTIGNVPILDGNKTYNMTCFNNVGHGHSPTYFFYSDVTGPTVGTTSFISLRPFFMGENISGQFNMSDNLILYSYNFSIDNAQVKYNNTLADLGANQNVSVQFSYPITNLSPGSHTLGLRIADGHTSQILQNQYLFDTGSMIADGLTITVVEPGTSDQRTIKIKNMKGSMSDTYNITPQMDRFSYTYTPATLDSSYEFILTSTHEISILRAHDTPYQEWIVTGNNWVDFLLENQPNEIVRIEKIDDYNVKVLLTGLEFDSIKEQDNNKDKQKPKNNKNTDKSLKFHSIGELNVVQYNYTFFTYNATITDYSSVINNAQYLGSIRFNKGNDSFYAYNITRSYNLSAPILNRTGIIDQNVTTSPFYENWNVTYQSPNVPLTGGTVVFNVNYSWKIGAYNHSLNFTQTVIPMGIGNCTNDTWAKSINFLMYDEDFSNVSDPHYVNSTLNVWLEVTPIGVGGGGKVNTSIAFIGGWNYSICILPNTSVAVGNSIMEYYAPEYSNRKFYLLNFNLSNITKIVPLYLVNNTKATNIQMKVYDKSTGAAVSGAYIQVLRYYPELGAYRTVEIEKTDDTGYAVGKLIPFDIFYRFNVIYNNELKLESQLQTIYTTTKLLPISLSEDVLRSFQFIGSISQNTTCNINTRTCTFVWTDVSGLTELAEFNVYKVNAWGKNLIYHQSIASPSGLMFYTVPMAEDMNGSVYTAEGSIETNTVNSKYVMSRAQMSTKSGLEMWGGVQTVLYGMMLVVVALGFIFIDLGPAGVICGTLIALIFGSWMGWIPLMYPALVSLCIIGGIIISKIRFGG